MSENILARLFAHNNWANATLITACAALSDAQLSHAPDTATAGTIRHTLQHLVEAQQGYYCQLVGIEPLYAWPDAAAPFDELQQAADEMGAGLLSLAEQPRDKFATTPYPRGDYIITPWVVMVQAINHATEHREQIKSMMSALGVEPPRIDGWGYGFAVGAVDGPED